jgi:hypothetical protein
MVISVFEFRTGISAGKVPKSGIRHLADGGFMPVLCKVGNRRDTSDVHVIKQIGLLGDIARSLP